MALRGLLLIGVMAWMLCTMPALAQQASAPARPPQEPILRIDPGMHTAVISHIGVNDACTLLATGSEDKTVRLWRLPEGKLLRTLRPPIGPENDGVVYAVTVVPDGSWVAAGGLTNAQSHFVYVFESTTGVMTAQLGPLGDVIRHLTVSPNGRYLAAILGGGGGLRVWERAGDPSRWRLVAEDREYGGQDSYGAAFDRAGVLYTTSYGGKLRRYTPGYSAKPAWVAIGGEPYSVAVHPSGDRVAVGYVNSPVVEIYDTGTLARRFATDVASSGNLAAVAWSADGNRLYAGGQVYRGDRFTFRIWERAGEGSVVEVDGPHDTIMDLVPCGDGIAFGSQDPAFGVVAVDGSRRLWLEGVQPDLRAKRNTDGLAISADGRRVRFGLERYGQRPVTVDLATEQLDPTPSPHGDLATADTTSLPVIDWYDGRNPRLDSTPLPLEQFEVASSLAIAPDKERFVLGAYWSLRGYDKVGAKLWQKPVPGATWGVNIPRSRDLVVAAYGDGTIRWHRLADGQELLALFVHKEDRRWVAWTPKGYYMASAGAESLIGWHVNRGWDEAAQFFPVDRFREQFNRPDIVKLVLETLDEERAIEEANKRANVKRAVENVRDIAPPHVVIQKAGLDATFDTREVTIEYNVVSHAGLKDHALTILINNAALGARLVPQRDSTTTTSHRVTLPVPPEDVTISLVAREGERASEPATIRLRWNGAKPGQVALPRLRALLIGVNEYASPKLTKLNFATKDAKELHDFFVAEEGRSYRKVDARVLLDARRDDILEGLTWLEKGSERDDVNLLFLAGHGRTRDSDRMFYFMAADSDPDRERATAVSRGEIQQTVQGRKGAMVVMLDTCHSAGSAEGITSVVGQVDMNRAANELGDRSLGVLLYASASGRQVAFERPEWGNGAFTRALLDGLKGGADRDSLGYVDTQDLYSYVRRRVLDMTKGQQEPVRVKPDAAPEMKLVLLK